MTKNNRSIEDHLAELKSITEKMRTDISLDETVTLYKNGVEIANKAKALLEKYEKEIEIIGNERLSETNE